MFGTFCAPQIRRIPNSPAGFRADNNFRLARNLSRIDAKYGDHFLQTGFPVVFPPWKPDSSRVPTNLELIRWTLVL
jgi:hypothetical protein